MTAVALIGLGTNLNREYNMLLGLAKTLEAFHVTRISSVYETAPIGDAAGTRNYFNSCVLAEVDLERDGLRQKLRAIEADAGRDRSTGSPYRTLDLDLLAFGPSVDDLEWIPNPAIAAYETPLVELGISANAASAEAVCVWRRTDVVVQPEE